MKIWELCIKLYLPTVNHINPKVCDHTIQALHCNHIVLYAGVLCIHQQEIGLLKPMKKLEEWTA